MSEKPKKPLKKITKNGRVIHKRTKKLYKEIWKYFLNNEAEAYCENMGYDLDTIKKIGYENFIDAHDWCSVEDVSKWRTDVIHIVPCVECGSDFATYELDLGLCSNCAGKYDLRKFGHDCNISDERQKGSNQALRLRFVYDENFRKVYKF